MIVFISTEPSEFMPRSRLAGESSGSILLSDVDERMIIFLYSKYVPIEGQYITKCS